MVFAAAVTFGAATGSASWEYGEPKNDPALASLSSQSGMGIGGTLEQFPSVLFPAYPENSCGGVVGTETHRAVMPYGCVTLEAGQAGTTSEHNILSSFATAGDESGPQEPLYLNLFLPTHVDHDGAVVAAASVRVRMLGGVLSEAEMRAVLAVAGWPEALHSEALAVSWCESKWSPFALGDSGRSAGLFQVNRATWFPYAGEDPEQWADPVVNARVAWAVYRYDIGRGYEPWRQWSCKTR